MNKRNKIIHIVILGIAVVFIALSLSIAPLSDLSISSDAAYPLLISGLCLIFALWAIFDDKRTIAEQPQDPQPTLLDPEVLVMVGIMALYGVLLSWIGYILSTLVYCALSIWYLYRRDWKVSFLVSFISTFMIVLIFKYGFHVILP